MIPVFDGEDYGNWKKKVNKCYQVVTREKVSRDKEDWGQNNLRAINYIYSAITNKQLEFVGDKETAHGILKKV